MVRLAGEPSDTMPIDRLLRGIDRRAAGWAESAARLRRPVASWRVPLESPRGHRLPCRLLAPATSGRWPGVLVVAGGLGGLESTLAADAVVSAPRLARAGLAVLIHTPSGREDAAGDEDWNGPLHQEELARALERLLRHPAVADGVVTVVSSSFGVAAAVPALAARPRLAARVRQLIDWEGPGSRRWFERVDFHVPSSDDTFWGPREAVAHVGRLRCPYRRVQSAWDHVHGDAPDIALEMVRAAVAGGVPRVWLNDVPQPGPVRWIAARPSVQGRRIVAWATGA